MPLSWCSRMRQWAITSRGWSRRAGCRPPDRGVRPGVGVQPFGPAQVARGTGHLAPPGRSRLHGDSQPASLDDRGCRCLLETPVGHVVTRSGDALGIEIGVEGGVLPHRIHPVRAMVGIGSPTCGAARRSTAPPPTSSKASRPTAPDAPRSCDQERVVPAARTTTRPPHAYGARPQADGRRERRDGHRPPDRPARSPLTPAELSKHPMRAPTDDRVIHARTLRQRRSATALTTPWRAHAPYGWVVAPANTHRSGGRRSPPGVTRRRHVCPGTTTSAARRGVRDAHRSATRQPSSASATYPP